MSDYRLIDLGSTGVAIVSVADYWWLSILRWHKRQYNMYEYAVEMDTRVLMHRLITGAPEGLVVDHINGCTFDNRRENLRVVERIQNVWNQTSRGGRSKYKGVNINPKYPNRYSASICRDGKRTHLGTFDSEIEAALAYDRACVKHDGKFARLNFPHGFQSLSLDQVSSNHTP